MKPDSPHAVPHEFFTFQIPLVSVPTNKTQWLILAAQLLNTPEWYWAQFEASTVTESGLEVIPFISPVQPVTDPTLLILNSPPFLKQLRC